MGENREAGDSRALTHYSLPPFADAIGNPSHGCFALHDLIRRHELVRFVRLLDRARAVDHRRNPGALQLRAFRAERHLADYG